MKRRPVIKPGELHVYYGKDDDGDTDMVIAWGDGVPRCDRALLYVQFGADRLNEKMEMEPSFRKELEARGYDITTIRFSIQRKSAT